MVRLAGVLAACACMFDSTVGTGGHLKRHHGSGWQDGLSVGELEVRSVLDAQAGLGHGEFERSSDLVLASGLEAGRVLRGKWGSARR